MKKITVAKAILKALEAEGVKIVFGISGGAILPFYKKTFLKILSFKLSN